MCETMPDTHQTPTYLFSDYRNMSVFMLKIFFRVYLSFFFKKKKENRDWSISTV